MPKKKLLVKKRSPKSARTESTLKQTDVTRRLIQAAEARANRKIAALDIWVNAMAADVRAEIKNVAIDQGAALASLQQRLEKIKA